MSSFWSINFHCQSSLSWTNWFTLQRQRKELPTSHQRLEICRLLVLSNTGSTLRRALLVFSFRDRPLLWLQGKIPCWERQSAAPVLAKRWVASPIKQQQRWDHFFLHRRKATWRLLPIKMRRLLLSWPLLISFWACILFRGLRYCTSANRRATK